MPLRRVILLSISTHFSHMAALAFAGHDCLPKTGIANLFPSARPTGATTTERSPNQYHDERNHLAGSPKKGDPQNPHGGRGSSAALNTSRKYSSVADIKIIAFSLSIQIGGTKRTYPRNRNMDQKIERRAELSLVVVSLSTATLIACFSVALAIL
jgi:hypothetical protein